MIIQEAALKQMDQRVKELEARVAQLQQTANGQQSSGGFRRPVRRRQPQYAKPA